MERVGLNALDEKAQSAGNYYRGCSFSLHTLSFQKFGGNSKVYCWLWICVGCVDKERLKANTVRGNDTSDAILSYKAQFSHQHCFWWCRFKWIGGIWKLLLFHLPDFSPAGETFTPTRFWWSALLERLKEKFAFFHCPNFLPVTHLTCAARCTGACVRVCVCVCVFVFGQFHPGPQKGS